MLYHLSPFKLSFVINMYMYVFFLIRKTNRKWTNDWEENLILIKPEISMKKVHKKIGLRISHFALHTFTLFIACAFQPNPIITIWHNICVWLNNNNMVMCIMHIKTKLHSYEYWFLDQSIELYWLYVWSIVECDEQMI